MSGIKIGSNIGSLNAQRKLSDSTIALGKVFERLSSGQRINRASDDAAGLAIAATLNAHGRVYGQAIRNVNDGLSVLNIAQAAMGELTSIVDRTQELAAQSANGIYSSRQRQALNAEAQALIDEYARILSVTEFNGRKLFSNPAQEIKIQSGFGDQAQTNITLGAALFAESQEVVTSELVGTGTYQSAQTVISGLNPYYVKASDLDGDGAMDLVSLDSGNNQFTVRLGNDDGTFNDSTIAIGSSAARFEFVDLNDDDRADLVFSAGAGTSRLFVMMNAGNGTFGAAQSFASGNAYGEFDSGDINGDGEIDLVMSNFSDNEAYIYYGNGNGTFAAAVTLDTGALPGGDKIFLEDFDNDDILDISVLIGGNGVISTLKGNGDGTFLTPAFWVSAGTSTYEGRSADINEDGFVDIVVANSNTNTVRIMEGTGDLTSAGGTVGFVTGEIIAMATPGSRISAVEIADINEDGHWDLVATSWDEDIVGTRLGNGDGTFNSLSTFAVGDRPEDVAAADFNGDGVIDLMVSSVDDDRLAMLLGDSETVLRSTITPGAAAFASVDISSVANARAALDTIAGVRLSLQTELSAIGSTQSRLEIVNSNLISAQINYKAAESQIVSVDVASESSEAIRLSILQNSALGILTQANQSPTLALSLLNSI